MQIVHSAFYRFVRIPDAAEIAHRVQRLCTKLTGSVTVAGEGINGAVAGLEQNVSEFESGLRSVTGFAELSFKRSECKTPPFGRMKVQVKDRIVAFGDVDESVFGERTTAVSPDVWRELIGRDDVVVIDNRNSFEYRLGRFANAVDPKVSHFSDFSNYVESHVDEWKREGKTVAMYCTGGIRCERVAPWMKTKGLNVVELDGGILNYFATMKDAERDWQGECFVFDNRIALDTKLRETETTEEQVYEGEADGEWRIARARRLRDSV